MAWLKKTIVIPPGWKDKIITLHFEAVAGECVVLVNGAEVARNFDAWLPFDADITGYVKKDAPNEILIGLRHTRLFDKKHPDYRYFGATYPSGSNTDDLIGIWQDVFLHAVPEINISGVFVKPWLNRDELEIEAEVTKNSSKKIKIWLEGDVKEWMNLASSENATKAAEINWTLGNTALAVASKEVELNAGETKTVVLKTPVGNRLKKWSPDHPNLYTLLLQIKNKKSTMDCRATRFGWRQFTIAGKDFHLNGKKIQCFGDIQHPFGPYICSRRFAYAWYQMIKDFGGNAVRPHAQPWPRVYYDLADEMGLMVLDETALFGSSIRLNLEEEITWQRSHEHLERLILRDRNHPSVIGWSAGNEMFAIALLNKPPKEIADKWDDRMAGLTLSAKKYDPTRDFITCDGDRDMDGRLPVWSKHFAHGLKIEDLPLDLNKPLIVGESGATYYGRPIQLYPFSGESAFTSYYGRNEALAVDVYQNAVHMARPYLAYFSPSEVCWFGIEHMNLGYHDFSRFPGLQDGIFPGKAFREGVPGYQFERIPPYVTTFNPGLDPALPLYKELPMFQALRAALKYEKPQPIIWDTFKEIIRPERTKFSDAQYTSVGFSDDISSALLPFMERVGITISKKQPDCIIIDAETFTEEQSNVISKLLEQIQKNGGIVWLMLADGKPSSAASSILPFPLEITSRKATALKSDRADGWGRFFDIPSLYFSEIKGDDRNMMKQGLSGELVRQGTVIFSPSETDWSLFNDHPENRKCAQVVLYEQLQKQEGAALVSLPYGKGKLVVSTIDYRINTPETLEFWRDLCSAMQIAWSAETIKSGDESKKAHDLLLDGPVE
jgi:beta-galactosidase